MIEGTKLYVHSFHVFRPLVARKSRRSLGVVVPIAVVVTYKRTHNYIAFLDQIDRPPLIGTARRATRQLRPAATQPAL